MQKNLLIGVGAVVLIGSIISFSSPQKTSPPALQNEAEPTPSSTNSTQPSMNPTIALETSLGPITIELFPQDAPKTVENFLKLTGEGFYDGIAFHRVIKGFMIQVGDPLTKDPSKMALWGTGGPGYRFEDELNPATESYKGGYVRGAVAMANAGPNTNGSQFFIMHADVPLPHAYTIFGRVTSGLETVDKIASAPVGANDRPVSAITITKAVASGN